MSKYSYNEGSREISGFGGSYEEACRKMVIAGMEWWDEHPEADVRWQEAKNIRGIQFNESEDCKAMQKHMSEAVGDDATGAMMQYTCNHVLAARRLGWDGYMEKMKESPEETTAD